MTLYSEKGNPELFSKADGEMISEKNKELRTQMSATPTISLLKSM